MAWEDYLSIFCETGKITLNKLHIFMHIFVGKIPVTQKLQTFVEASENVYGAAIYEQAYG